MSTISKFLNQKLTLWLRHARSEPAVSPLPPRKTLPGVTVQFRSPKQSAFKPKPPNGSDYASNM